MRREKTKVMKISEARIIIYLKNVKKTLKDVRSISIKLNIDSCYVYRIISLMLSKGWLKTHNYNGRLFYDINSHTPILTARKVMSDNQRRLR